MQMQDNKDIFIYIRNGISYIPIKLKSNDRIEQLFEEVKNLIQSKTFRIMYRGKDITNTKQKNLQQIGLKDGSQIVVINRHLGGMKAFGTVLFNSMERQVSIKFNSLAPHWRIITPGLNLKGKCYNQCPAKNQVIWIQKGFGTFFINKEVQLSQCPKCKKKASDISNFGYYQCKIKVQGQAKDQQPFNFEDSHEGEQNMKTFSQDGGNLLEWNYLIIEVSKK